MMRRRELDRGKHSDTQHDGTRTSSFPMRANETDLHRNNNRFTNVLMLLVLLCMFILLQTQIATTNLQVSRSTVVEVTTEVRLTLMTNFWAQPEHEPKHDHRIEIEAALAANLENQHIDQVVVILDSVSYESNCSHFVRRMNELRRRTRSILENNKRPRLTCIPRNGAQPNYFEMFNYTLHPEIQGDVVMLSNADQVFDETVIMAKNIPSKTLWTLSSWGYQPDLVPKHFQMLYHLLVGIPAKESDSTVGKCSARTGYFSQDLSPSSWDTYIFHPSLIRETLKSDSFLRTKFDGTEGRFYMNEMGAENAALFDLSNDASMKGEISLWNACPIIQTWHYHLAPKTHRQDNHLIWPQAAWKKAKAALPSEFVPAPRVNAPMCHMAAECMLSRPVNVQDLAESQKLNGKRKLDDKYY